MSQHQSLLQDRVGLVSWWGSYEVSYQACGVLRERIDHVCKPLPLRHHSQHLETQLCPGNPDAWCLGPAMQHLTLLINILNGLVFFNRLQSNGLKNLMDQQLTEVTFGVTINV